MSNKNQTEIIQKPQPDGVAKLLNDVGLDREMVKGLVKTVASEYIKGQIGSPAKQVSKGTLGRLFAELKGAWWVFPLTVTATGLSIILIIVVWRIAMRLIS